MAVPYVLLVQLTVVPPAGIAVLAQPCLRYAAIAAKRLMLIVQVPAEQTMHANPKSLMVEVEL